MDTKDMKLGFVQNSSSGKTELIPVVAASTYSIQDHVDAIALVCEFIEKEHEDTISYLEEILDSDFFGDHEHEYIKRAEDKILEEMRKNAEVTLRGTAILKELKSTLERLQNVH